MGSKNWYDYLIEKGLPIPDDIRKQQSIYEFKDARTNFEKSYEKLCKRLDTKNNKYEQHTTFVLNNICDLSLITSDPDFHSMFLKKIFNYRAIKENYSRNSLNLYLENMCDRDDKESFRMIAYVLKAIVSKKQLSDEIDDVVKQTQLSYLGYLCMIRGGERKKISVANDILRSYQLKLTNSLEVLSLSFYTIEEEDLSNSNHTKYKKLFDIFNTYL